MNAMHPYSVAPERAFWSRSVSRKWNPSSLISDERRIRLDDKVVSAGSCFASNIVPYLAGANIEYVRTETVHPAFAEIYRERYGYTSFSAAYGNIYTARQLLQLLWRARGDFKPIEDRWPSNDGLIDPFRPGLPYRPQTDEEFDALTKQHLQRTLGAFEQATVFVFTLGLTEAWVSKLDGAVFPACPGTIAGEFDHTKHEFYNFNTEEVANDLKEFCELFRRINPNARILLTVSPVPLVATATNEHVLTASTYSKSVLRAAAQQVCQISPNAFYFPSYELITGPQAPDDFFEPDKRNVSKRGIETVMQSLLGEKMTPASTQSRLKNVQAALSSLVAVQECEEGALDAAAHSEAEIAIPHAALSAPEPEFSSDTASKIVFLHIPKTAGQALRQYLENSFPKSLMFPGYIDADLLTRSKSELDRYQIYSGHFSPALLDSLTGTIFKFSILREPSDRIVSLYRYLRAEGMKKSKVELALPSNSLHKAAVEQPIDVFLQANDCDGVTRQLILSGCYNFYAYYFGARFQTARALTDSDDQSYTYKLASNLVETAVSNIERDGIKLYYFDSLDRLVTDLGNLPKARASQLNAINTNPGGSIDRNEFIEATASNPSRARELLHMYAEFDRKIFDYFHP
jgi:hypothetical protein